MYLDLIKGYKVTRGGYNALLKERRENTATIFSSLGNKAIIIPHTDNYSMCGPKFSLFLHHKLSCMACVYLQGEPPNWSLWQMSMQVLRRWRKNTSPESERRQVAQVLKRLGLGRFASTIDTRGTLCH